MTLTTVRRVTLAVLSAAVFLSAAWAQSDPLPIDPDAGEGTAAASAQEKELQDALEEFKKGNFDETLKMLEAAVEKYPRLPPAQVIMATWFFQARRPDLGRAALERAVLDTPDDPEPYLLFADLGLQDRQGRRVTAACVLYEKGAELLAKFNGDAERKKLMEQHVERGLSSVAAARQQWDVAQQHLEKWLELSPGNARALVALASVLFQQDLIDESLARLKAAAEANENSLTPEAQIALWYEQKGDSKKAEEWMIKALTTDTKNPRTRLAAAQWALNAGRIEEARDQCDYAIKLEATLAAKQLRGIIALFEKDFREAEKQFEAVVDEQPSSFAATNNLALALIEQDEVRKQRRALDLAADNARQYNRSAEAFSTYGWILYKLGQIDQAIQALQQSFRLDNTPSPDTMYYMAQALYDKEQYEQAKQLVDKALESKRPFSMKKETEELVKELKDKVKVKEEPATKE
jgi:tetratricopeptide (TPR) repeat protein